MTHYVLLPGDWNGSDAYLCRPLIGSREGRPPGVPWVALATGHTDGRYDLVPVDVDASVARKHLADAESHAAGSQVEWQVTEQSGFLFWKRPSQVRAIASREPGETPDVMDDLSAELILSPPILAGASEALGATELIAVVPKRGWLLVIAGAAGDFPKMMQMNQIAIGVHGRAGADAISPYAFFVRDGQLVGANVLEDGGGYMHLTSPDEVDWNGSI